MFIIELFIRLVFEQFMKPTKNIIISADRMRVIHMDSSYIVDTKVTNVACKLVMANYPLLMWIRVQCVKGPYPSSSLNPHTFYYHRRFKLFHQIH